MGFGLFGISAIAAAIIMCRTAAVHDILRLHPEK